jgi:hypothetical protein
MTFLPLLYVSETWVNKNTNISTIQAAAIRILRRVNCGLDKH